MKEHLKRLNDWAYCPYAIKKCIRGRRMVSAAGLKPKNKEYVSTAEAVSITPNSDSYRILRS